MRLSDGQPGSVIHGEVLDGGQRLRTGEADVAHVADVKDTDPGADGRVFVDNAATDRGRIFDRHIPAIELHHLGAHLAMDGVQRSFADGGRLNRRQSRPQSTSSGWLPGWCD